MQNNQHNYNPTFSISFAESKKKMKVQENAMVLKNKCKPVEMHHAVNIDLEKMKTIRFQYIENNGNKKPGQCQ